MSHSKKVQSIIEETVGAVLDAALPKLRVEIIDRTVRELRSLEPEPGNLPTDVLNAALVSIQDSTSQAEILRRLLEGSASFCGRAALLVVKGGSVSGWQGSGFDSNEVLKALNWNANAGLVSAAIEARGPVSGKAVEVDGGFVSAVGAPIDGNCVVLPLVVKEKVPALIYADVGRLPDSAIDISALTVLCRFAGLWLELMALRKGGVAAAAEEPQMQSAAAATAAPTMQVGHANEPVAVGEEEEVHKKARRYAKVLVDEIKLYNQLKVAEGKQTKDLYERLREDIEKSRAAYNKRFGSGPAASANYFTQELIRILADNDISLMGGSFPR
jgi:hypothetical protein